VLLQLMLKYHQLQTSAIDSNDSPTESDKLTYLCAAIKRKKEAEIVSSSSIKHNEYFAIIDLMKKVLWHKGLVYRLHGQAIFSYKLKNSSYEKKCKLLVLWKKHIAAFMTLSSMKIVPRMVPNLRVLHEFLE